MSNNNTKPQSAPAISRGSCLAIMRYVVRNLIDFDARQCDLMAWLTHTGELFIRLEHLLQHMRESLASRTTQGSKSDEVLFKLLIEYKLVVRASILHVTWDGGLEVLAEIHPDLIWDEGEKRPNRWEFKSFDEWNYWDSGSSRPILDVPPIFQRWPKLALLHECYPTPSVHRLESQRLSARHEVLAIYPSEREIEHLRRARRTSK